MQLLGTLRMILSFSLVFLFLVSKMVLSVILQQFYEKRDFMIKFQLLLLNIIIEIFASKTLFVPLNNKIKTLNFMHHLHRRFLTF